MDAAIIWILFICPTSQDCYMFNVYKTKELCKNHQIYRDRQVNWGTGKNLAYCSAYWVIE